MAGRSSGARRTAETVQRAGRGGLGSRRAMGGDDRDEEISPMSATMLLPMEFDLDRSLGEDGVSEKDLKTLMRLGKRDIMPPPMPVRHSDNLLALVKPAALDKLANDLLREVQSAARSRAPWMRAMADGIKRLGFDRTGSPMRNTPFKGSSAVVHPAFAQACVDLQARTSAQLCPPSGPAKTVIIGDETPDLVDRCDRVESFMNYQCTTQIREWRSEKERALMMVGPEGSTFFKLWYDRSLRRPRAAYIPAEDVIIPYAASDHMTSPLVAEVLRKLPSDVREHVRSRDWADHDFGAPDYEGRSNVVSATDRVTGIEPDGEQILEHEPLIYYECQVKRAIPGLELDPKGRPMESEFLVTVCKASRCIVAIRRNWSELDPVRERFQLLHHYKAFPWRGVYGIGLYHLIGGLSIAATGALRALLDTGHWQNAVGGFKLKGARTSAQTIERSPGQWVDIEAPAAIDDIRKVLMQDPHEGPSEVLFELLKFLADSASKFASVALAEVAESNANVPVGTTMARLDEASRVFSAIYQRLHAVQDLELKALYKINRATLSQQLSLLPSDAPMVRVPGPPEEPGGPAEPGDFNVSISVQPVSDPHTHSAIQRTMQHQARLDLARNARMDGIEVDLRGAYLDAAKGMKLPEPESLFPEPPPPLPPGDPFSENLKLSQGARIEAGPTQDHDIHLIVHLARLSLPNVLMSPMAVPLLAHIEEHLTYGALALALAGKMATNAPSAPANQAAKPADAGEWYLKWIEMLRPLVQPPAEPGVQALVEAEKAKTQAHREEADIKVEATKEIEGVKVAAQKDIIAAELQAKLIEIRAKQDQHNLAEATKLQTAREAAASRERIAAAEIAAKTVQERNKPAPATAGRKPVAGKKRR